MPAPAGEGATRIRLAPFDRLGYLEIEVLQEEAPAAIVGRLRACDEVWCCPSVRQSLSTKSMPWVVYDLGVRGPNGQRFKMVPPWAEPPVESLPNRDRPKKQTPLKGW